MDRLIELNLESLKHGLISSDKYFKTPVVIFNSASFCGYAVQFQEFQELFHDRKIIPVALPTNDFDSGEPGDDYELLQYYVSRYSIGFPICRKTDSTHKIFSKYGAPKWNFNKYLFDRNHQFVRRFDSDVNPKDLLQYV